MTPTTRALVALARRLATVALARRQLAERRTSGHALAAAARDVAKRADDLGRAVVVLVGRLRENTN